MTHDNFTCYRCHQTFTKKWSDEEAMKEFENAPWNVPGDKIDVICDDCFILFQKWFDSLSEEQHQIIRNFKA